MFSPSEISSVSSKLSLHSDKMPFTTFKRENIVQGSPQMVSKFILCCMQYYITVIILLFTEKPNFNYEMGSDWRRSFGFLGCHEDIRQS